jgi:two-component system cell cycle response regulator DivK
MATWNRAPLALESISMMTDRDRRRVPRAASRPGEFRRSGSKGRPPKPVVLVVDDDADARTIYAMSLRAKGCEVFTGKDGREALEKANALWPDVIVMDLAMPHIDGWEAIRRLNESSWTRRIPIVAVSAVPYSRQTALAAGCDAYLTKPCDPQSLWTQVRTLLGLPDSGSEIH